MYENLDADPPGPYELHALDMGVYRWGSLLPEFKPLGPVKAQDLPRNLAGLIERVGNWETPAGFRGWASFSHELTHYLQDLTTGVGHWDHMIRNQTRRGLFIEAQRLCRPETEFPVSAMARSKALSDPSSVTALADALEAHARLRDQLIVAVGDAAPPTRQHALEERAAPLLQPDGRVDAFRIEALLEGEAMSVVIRQVLRTREATALQWEILNENAGIWHPGEMLPEYGGLWFETVAVMQHLYGEDPASMSDRERDAFYELVGAFLGLLVDIACAHPSPALIEEIGADRREYEPGLRYLRLLTSIAAVFAADGEQEVGELVPAVVAHDLERAEALLLEHCGYPYLTSRAVYEDWLPRLEAGAGATMTRWTELLRAECCRTRLDEPGAWVEKAPFALIEHKVPLLLIGPEGISSMAQRWEHLEPEAAKAIYGDLTRHDIELESSDFFYETGRFSCTLGRARTCEVATDECRKGLRRPSAFPNEQECRVREWLEENAFDLGGKK